MLKQKILARPDILIYNLSVYRNQILRNMIIRTVMNSSSSYNILHLHGGRFFDIQLTKKWYFRFLLKYHLRRFNKIFCLTNEQYGAVVDILKSAKNVKKINNYVELPNERLLDKKDDVLNLLYIGRLHPLKGLREAINAIYQIKSERIRFWIIGSGELETELVQIKDERIVFLGKKIGADKETYLSKAHVFLLPSWSEGLPYALLEAAAYGLALVGTQVGAVDQVIYHGKNGFFIKPGDVTNLKEMIEILLADREETLKMGRESRKICEERFSIQGLKQIYDKILED